jgi:hypothetical protein
MIVTSGTQGGTVFYPKKGSWAKELALKCTKWIKYIELDGPEA